MVALCSSLDFMLERTRGCLMPNSTNRTGFSSIQSSFLLQLVGELGVGERLGLNPVLLKQVNGNLLEPVALVKGFGLAEAIR